MGHMLASVCSVVVAVGAWAAVDAAVDPVEVPGSAPGLAAQGPAPNTHERSTTREKESTGIEVAKLRLREGSRLRDVAGHFRQSGDALTFIDGENREISGLPNLNLERIIRMLKAVDEPESIAWSVSGTITEFSGRNYLLISRAVYKAATPPPAPDRLGAEKVEDK